MTVKVRCGEESLRVTRDAPFSFRRIARKVLEQWEARTIQLFVFTKTTP
jgi:hypothetical protein